MRGLAATTSVRSFVSLMNAGLNSAVRVGTAPADAVSVVIPCLNEAAHLERLLDTVLAQDASVAEIIVVDNGSTDHTADVAKSYALRHPEVPVHVLACERPGAAAALNAGVRAASGEIIVRLDGHSRPRPDYVRRAVAALQRPDVGVAGGVWEIVPSAETTVGRAIACAAAQLVGSGGAAYRTPRRLTGPTEVDTVPFGCFRKSLWNALGGYLEHLQTNEDYIFNYRSRRIGQRVVLDPAMRCVYLARPTFRPLAAQYFRYGWWKARMLKAFPSAMRLRQAVPVIFVTMLVALGLAGVVVPGVWQAAAGLVGVYLTSLVAVSIPAALRDRDVGLIPALASAFAIMHVTWGAGFLVSLISAGRWPRWDVRAALRPSGVEIEHT